MQIFVTQYHLRNGINLRSWFEKRVQEHDLLEIAAPPSLSLCCFRIKGTVKHFYGTACVSYPFYVIDTPLILANLASGLSDAQHKAFLDNLNEDGEIFIIHSSLGNRYVHMSSHAYHVHTCTWYYWQ